ncbi:hypothetical protein ABW19_dt0204604 [Dactylella cylindrospora]|nr:hypothetical protein ABW19_dt0204604 [Dactylella cylindrospora]
MFSTSLIAVALTTLLSVNAQTYWTINPDDLDLGTKQTWCQNQISSCSLLCLDQQSGGGFTNDCDPETLVYNCICADNTVPNATEYSQTIPYFLCTYSVENCVQNCGPSDPTCAQLCRSGRTCGASNPTRAKSSSTFTVVSTTSTKKSTSTGVAGDDDEAFDEPTATDAEATPTGDDDAAAASETGTESEETNTPNAGNRLSSVAGSAMGFSVMILSVACGAFVFQL